jgi:hypothetical protein
MSLHQRSTSRNCTAIIPTMRIRILTVLGVWLICGLVLAQTTPKPLHADRVVVLKKERTLQLLSQGKVIKTYKVALGGDPVGAKASPGRSQDSRRRIRPRCAQRPQPVLQVDSHFVSQRTRPRSGAEEGRLPRWGRVCARTSERLRVGGSSAPGEGLDRWMHRGHQSGDRRNLAGRGGWDAD